MNKESYSCIDDILRGLKSGKISMPLVIFLLTKKTLLELRSFKATNSFDEEFVKEYIDKCEQINNNLALNSIIVNRILEQLKFTSMPSFLEQEPNFIKDLIEKLKMSDDKIFAPEILNKCERILKHLKLKIFW